MAMRSRDAEAELNLPPGFRFHPTDEELVIHYLCRKATHQFLPVPIIAEVDLYKYDPWQLPEKALFGQKEWYFFTPRDRKYPNGSRPNRAAGSGYWKATGADKPVTPAGNSRPLGIKKALVFYAGKAPKGVKTNWIMHEYRLAQNSRTRTASNKDSLRLDDWVLCRLYNKKNDWEKKETQQKQKQKQEAGEASFGETFGSPLSDVDNEEYAEIAAQNNSGLPSTTWNSSGVGGVKEDNEWFMDLKLDDLQNSYATFAGGDGGTMAMDMPLYHYQDYCFSGFPSPVPKISYQNSVQPPF